MSKRYSFLAVTLIVTATCALALSSHATTTTLVNDTWQDGTRTDPASPTYAENNGTSATDADSDGNLESAWFASNSASLTVAGPGDLRGAVPTTSLSMYTYFTQPTTPVTLANIGDELKLTWQFTPNGTITVNTSQGFLLALGLTPNGSRNTADGGIQSANYTNSFAMFMNMSSTMGNGNSFQLRKWGLAGSGAFLGTSGNWTALTNGVASGTTGYTVGTQYTFVYDLTMTAGGLQVVSSMSGDNIGGTGSISDTFVDPSITSVSYDTFDIRPAGSATGASQIDTSLFKVDLTTVPEPSTVMLVGAGLGLMLTLARRRRS
ncbi:MAG TPA: PEP-CTERM sorting domain-containing protein [Verrucomicrobiae bacterium]|nr:PEP-CTERM sorting domain-containing protein [Verrucomicrobiae bacterium]